MANTPAQDEWAKVEKALKTSDWDFRTVGGLAKDVGLSPHEVKRLLDRHRSQVRAALSRDRRLVYALRSKRRTLREVYDRFLALASD